MSMYAETPVRSSARPTSGRLRVCRLPSRDFDEHFVANVCLQNLGQFGRDDKAVRGKRELAIGSINHAPVQAVGRLAMNGKLPAAVTKPEANCGVAKRFDVDRARQFVAASGSL
jgi:hypothetical protein